MLVNPTVHYAGNCIEFGMTSWRLDPLFSHASLLVFAFHYSGCTKSVDGKTVFISDKFSKHTQTKVKAQKITFQEISKVLHLL